MNADLSTLLMSGAVAILTATIGLVLLVRHDLAPAALTRGTGRWFLGAALGIGVIAFTLKVVVILILANFPDRTVAPLIAGVGKVPPPAGLDLGPGHSAPLSFQTLPEVAPAPPDNPTTPEKVALGERLFHDPLLSFDRTVSCASCHDVTTGAGTDGRPTAVGITRQPGSRNSPTVYNAAYQARLFWDGRAGSLEDQALGPPLNPAEMGMPSFAAIEERVSAVPGYRQAFAAAFGDAQPVTMRRIAQAIAAFERTLVSRDSPYDRFVSGDDTALTDRQKRGMWLFQTVGCVTCHSGPNFSGASLVGPRNPYAPLSAQRSEPARRHGLDADKGKAAAGARDGVWRIPSLRNVALTAPYFHNGGVSDLREAVRVMATAQLGAELSERPGAAEPHWNAERRVFATASRLVLTPRDVDDLAAFLESLSGDALAARTGARASR